MANGYGLSSVPIGSCLCCGLVEEHPGFFTMERDEGSQVNHNGRCLELTTLVAFFSYCEEVCILIPLLLLIL
jgi:hypothetical protein